MTGFDCVCEAIDRFETALATTGATKIRTVREFSALAGYSVYHFTRLFFAVTGQSPKDYLSSRILSQAARSVAMTNHPLGSIAEDAGYPDYETFSRAFKRRFGVPPRRIRETGILPAACVPRLSPTPQKAPAGKTGLAFPEKPEHVVLESFHITGLPFHIEEGTLSFQKQWDTFMAIERRVAGRIEPAPFCQFSAWTEDEAMTGLSVLCAVETIPSSAQESIFTSRAVPAAAYLRFTHRGPPATLFETYSYIYRIWMAGHPEKPFGQWEFQRYPPGEPITQIYIPMAPC